MRLGLLIAASVLVLSACAAPGAGPSTPPSAPSANPTGQTYADQDLTKPTGEWRLKGRAMAAAAAPSVAAPSWRLIAPNLVTLNNARKGKW